MKNSQVNAECNGSNNGNNSNQSPIMSGAEASLILMFVALGFGIVGISLADSFKLHRLIMTGAVVLNLIAIFVLMFPSIFLYYINLNNSVSSPLSALQIIHAAVGFPAVTLSLMYVFNDLPQPTRRWMITTAALWVVNIALGVLVYLTIGPYGNSVNITGSSLAYLPNKDVYLGTNSIPVNPTTQNLESTLASSPYAVAGLGIIFLAALPIAWKHMQRNTKTKKKLEQN
jgi:uncharacterized membrane protein YozB (DUF420 family)